MAAFNIFGPVPAAFGGAAQVTSAVLYPDMTVRSSHLKQTPKAQTDNPAKALSCNKDQGDLYLEFQSRYTHQLRVSEMLHNLVPASSVALTTRFFPAEGCDWSEKPEVVITASLTPTPASGQNHHHNHHHNLRLSFRNVVLTRYTLDLVASKVPNGYRLEMKGCQVASPDHKTYPLFCESVDGFGSRTMSAVLHVPENGRVDLSFELRLVAVKPFDNVFAATQTLAGRLISSARDTGDVILRTQAGTELPAHSAVLSDIPYFKTRFGPDWKREPTAGERATCLLPVEADLESLVLFRSYVYGEPHRLEEVKSHTVLQALFSLGEACDLPTLCQEIASVVKIQGTEVSDWLDWLGREHLPEIEPIRKQVTSLVKEAVLSKKTFWDEATMEDLSHIYHATKRHKKSE